MTSGSDILQVNNLKTYFYGIQGTVKAVDGVNFKIKEGTTLGLAGESGCGKTTVAMSILNLIPHLRRDEDEAGNTVTRGEIVAGEILHKGRDLLKLSQEEIRQVRGKEISMIFQNPIPALNPMETIGFQVGEAITAHEQTRKEKLRELVIDYLGKVELKDAQKRFKNNPHMFSGGEGQRIMVAMAIINAPSLLIADEPTKSMDVIVQRQVLTIFQEMKKNFHLSMLLITHDLALIAELSDYVAIMYAGKIMEHGNVISIYKDPRHPYTQGLLTSVPRLDRRKTQRGLQGEHPNPFVDISGCKFHPRCPYATEICRRAEPPPTEVDADHVAACIRVKEIPEWHD